MRPFLFCLLLAAASACGDRNAVYAGADDQAPLPVAHPEQLDVRRVWSGSEADFYVSSPSPDGRLISEVDWVTGDLSVIDLETGAQRRVTSKGTWADNDDYAEHSVFSPDGLRIAYSWFSQQARGYQVRVSRLDGSDTQIIFDRKPDVAYAAVEDWSKDGRFVLVTAFRGDRTAQIGIVNVDTHEYRPLKTTDWRGPEAALFSPDGRFIAYDLTRSDDRDNRDLRIMAVDGTRDDTLVASEADELLMGWLPDGSGIMFRSRAQHMDALMALRVEDGVAAGRPQTVRPTGHITGFGFSRDAFFYGMRVEKRLLHIASLDLNAGRMVDHPAPFADDANGHAAWSSDGQSVAYVSTDGRHPELVIRSAAGELQRRLPLPLTDPRQIQWMPDGRAVLAFSADDAGRIGVHRVNLDDGGITPLLTRNPTDDIDADQFYAVSPDGLTIYQRLSSKNERGIYARDLGTGTARKVIDTPAGRMISVSPDGKWLAYTAEDMKLGACWILAVPTTGGTPRELFRQEGGCSGTGNNGGLPWAPDSRSFIVYVTTRSTQDPVQGGIWQIFLDGTPKRVIVPVIRDAEGRVDTPNVLRLSPDGKHVLFLQGRERSEYWMLKGFAPSPTAPGPAK